MDRPAHDSVFYARCKLTLGLFTQVAEDARDQFLQGPALPEHFCSLETAAAEKRLHRLDQPAFVLGFEVALNSFRSRPGLHQELVLLPDLLQV